MPLDTRGRAGGRIAAGVSLLIALLITSASATAAERKPGPVAKGKKDRETILVQFKADAESQAEGAIRSRGDVPAGKVAGRVHLVKIKKGETVEAKVAEYEARADVEYAEPNWIAEASALTPNDPRFGGQYGLSITNTPDAWSLYPGAFVFPGGPAIAVIDSGVESAHADLAAGVLSSSGANCATDEFLNDPACYAWPGGSTDANGHGTHVAGIAAAQTNNATGVAGMSFSSPIIPVKVLNAAGSGTFAAIANGITWARTHGAKVINMSLGGHPGVVPTTLCNAVTAATNAGILVVAAAGNEGTNDPSYPAACPGAIGIAATDSTDNSPEFSNWWYPNVFISAPGVDIDSTYPPGVYSLLTGTSMSSPHVAGLAALLFGQAPGRTIADVKRLLAKTADKPNPFHGTTFAGIPLEYTTDRWNVCAGTCSWHPFYGYGRIDSGQALLGVPPTLTTIVPTLGTTGTLVTVNGQDLATATALRFGAVSSIFTVVNATKLTTNVPASAITSQVAVETPAGTVNGPMFKVLPKITSFSEPDGAPGTPITISGSGFRAPIVVKFGLVAVAATLVNSQTITTTVPPTAATGKVSVQTPDGIATSAVDFGVPKITLLSPTQSTTGIVLTISGTGLGRTSGVTFNGTDGPVVTSVFSPQAVTSPTTVTATQVKVTVPPDAVTGTITVHTPTTNLVTPVYKILPKVSALTPPTGLTATPVTITGSGLNGATAVKFGLTSASFTVVSQNEITTAVPAGASSGKVSVTTPAGTGLSPADFGVTKITGLLPALGTTGTVLTINGTGLSTTTAVTIGGLAANIVPGSITATSVKVTIPVDATTGTIALTTPQGSVTFATPFKVLPKITSLVPADGIVGTSVQVEGSGFRGTPTVKFGTIVAPGATLNDSTTITVQVPPGTTFGKVSVQTVDGTAISVADFAVPKVTTLLPTQSTTGTLLTINGMGLGRTTGVTFAGVGGPTLPTSVTPTAVKVPVPDAAVTGALTVHTPTVDLTTASYKILPKVSSFTPTTGIGGLTSVTITGSGLNGATAVKFGLANQPTFTVDSPNQITTSVPAGAATGKVSVTTPAGIGTSVADFGVTKITGLLPTQGTTGSVLTINGSGLANTTGVTINGVAAPFAPIVGAITPITPTAVRVLVDPATTTGPVVLTTPQGAVSFATPFKVLPKVITVAPLDGKVGDLVTISGTGFRGFSPPIVKFGTIAVLPENVTLLNSQTITVPVPAGTTAGAVTVQTPDGIATSTSQFQITKLTGMLPAQGFTGTLVTLNGTGLGSTTGVTVGGVPATLTPPNTAGAVKFTIPNTATTGVVELTTPRVVLTLPTALKVLPKQTHFDQPDGAPGTVIEIHGSGFRKDPTTGAQPSVKFGTVPSPNVNWVSPNMVMAEVPVGAATNHVTITTVDGAAVCPVPFQVPKLTSFLPAMGLVNSAVTFSGTGLGRTSQVRFTGFGGTSINVTPTPPVNATTVKANVPAGAVNGPITLVTPTTNLVTTAFKVVPKIDGLSATSGPPNLPITITGSGLGDATQVKFGTVVATDVTVDSANQIKARVPTPPTPGAANGKITVVAPGGTALSVASFTVVPRQLLSIDVTPVSSTVNQGGTIQLTATGHFNDLTDENLTSTAVWTSSEPTVASVLAGLVTGLAVADAPVTITAAVGAVNDTATVKVAIDLVINEVDYDQPGGIDLLEFVEIKNPTSQPVSLAGVQLKLVNGASPDGGSVYNTIALSGTLPAGGYAVIKNSGVVVPVGPPTVELPLTANNIQNDLDGVVLIHDPSKTVLDALSYEGSVAPFEIWPSLPLVNLVEGTPTAAADSDVSTGSLVRLPDGADTDDAATDWAFTATPTPGVANP